MRHTWKPQRCLIAESRSPQVGPEPKMPISYCCTTMRLGDTSVVQVSRRETIISQFPVFGNGGRVFGRTPSAGRVAQAPQESGSFYRSRANGALLPLCHPYTLFYHTYPLTYSVLTQPIDDMSFWRLHIPAQLPPPCNPTIDGESRYDGLACLLAYY